MREVFVDELKPRLSATSRQWLAFRLHEDGNVSGRWCNCLPLSRMCWEDLGRLDNRHSTINCLIRKTPGLAGLISGVPPHAADVF